MHFQHSFIEYTNTYCIRRRKYFTRTIADESIDDVRGFYSLFRYHFAAAYDIHIPVILRDIETTVTSFNHVIDQGMRETIGRCIISEGVTIMATQSFPCQYPEKPQVILVETAYLVADKTVIDSIGAHKRVLRKYRQAGH